MLNRTSVLDPVESGNLFSNAVHSTFYIKMLYQSFDSHQDQKVQ